MGVLACPTCAGALTQAPWACTQCGRTFVTLGGDVPVLLESSRAALYDAIARNRRAALAVTKRQSALMDKDWSAHPPQVREGFFAALSDQLALLERHYALLMHDAGSTREVLDGIVASTAAQSDLYNEVERIVWYMKRDWNDVPSAEAEWAPMYAKATAKLPESRETALVLGAGLGRIAAELTQVYEHVVAFDFSMEMALTFLDLKRGRRDVTRAQLSNMRRAEDQITRYALTTENAGDLSRLTFAVADASKPPIAPGSISAIYSVFFTDVMPLREALPRYARQLKRNGWFVHFGPLHYHFEEPNGKLAADTVRHELDALGFDLIHEDWCELPIIEGPTESSSLSRVKYDSWCFIARLRDVQPVASSDRLQLIDGASVVSRKTMRNGGLTEAITLDHATTSLELTPFAQDFLPRLDGTQTLDEVCAALDLTGDDAVEALAFAQDLFDRGLLKR